MIIMISSDGAHKTCILLYLAKWVLLRIRSLSEATFNPAHLCCMLYLSLRSS